MSKTDYKKELKQLYKPSKKTFEIVEVPPLNFLMVDGAGNPNISPDYQELVGLLYGLSFNAKFISKNELGKDYVVMPLEGLWWADDMNAFTQLDKDDWKWTMMIMQPYHITPEIMEQARADFAKKKPEAAGRLPEVRLAEYDEGQSAQILYIGAYADEGPTIARLHAFIKENGYDRRGKHHEIYLSDPRRTAPEKLKTVIRQPVS